MANKKKTRLVEQLYDIAKTENEQGLTVMDEQKLRRALDGNNKLFASNKNIFEKEEPKAKTCKMYDPCPICFKCRNKASHLYVRCQTCQIPVCVHTYEQKKKMILRKNFKIKVSEETIKKIESVNK